ncbi:uncharacterized protein PHACADRAFT_196203 [Phanerochaete carnosa HHB-10118-sp]|uniref:Uncharacterized protein n=1 Tax=Phanerochaete carnosa (strain HHB-10118-sp) TaxID=650164 RepID=K5WAA2_PHACS|nr:uncharacterized protein PHACADRAFT_196203 [Phanerochaete carnosa HHB-10118-sp]EKM56150.1 hypothetical protein PHACADRAFT_196203 [Phanerochaete carnosa HHB-10118-sp]
MAPAHTPPAGSPPPVFSPQRQAQIAAAEQEGANLVASIYASGELPDFTINDDDWEDPVESDDSGNKGMSNPLSPVQPAQHDYLSPSSSPSLLTLPLPPAPDGSNLPVPDLPPNPFQRPSFTPAPIPSPANVHLHPVAYLIYLLLFCTLCWAEQKKKVPFTAKIFEENGYPCRTNEQHRHYQAEYQACMTDGAREAFVKKHAIRWSEFSHLPYFNFEKMVVVDCMHNLFLELVKTHFYHIWVKSKVLHKTKELNHLDAILNKMSLLAKVGRLPQLIGESASRSLTADQWLVLSTLIGPLAIPQIWQDYMSADPAAILAACKASIASTIAEKRSAAAAKRKSAQQKKRTKGKATRKQTSPVAESSTATRRSQRACQPTNRALSVDAASDSDVGKSEGKWLDDGAVDDIEDKTFNDEMPWRKRARGDNAADDSHKLSQLVPDDVVNFLKLCEALQLLLHGDITDDQIIQADKLIQKYGIGLIELYGPEVLKPNHHYTTQVGKFV